MDYFSERMETDSELFKKKLALVKAKKGRKSSDYKKLVGRDKSHDAPIKDKRGVRAYHKGKWGFMKDRKLTPD